MGSRKSLQTLKGITGGARFMMALAIALLLAGSSVLLSPSYSSKAGTAKTAATDSEVVARPDAKAMAPAAMQQAEMPHTLAATYYSLDDGLGSTLMLSNQEPKPMEISPTLFSLDGARFDVPPFILEGNTVSEFDVGKWADAAGRKFREGSLQVLYEGREMGLGGVLKLVDARRSLIFDEELSEPTMDFMSSRLEGVWWLPSHKAELRLIVSNTTGASLSATVSVAGTAPKQKVPEVLSLTPHETRVMDVQDLQEGKLTRVDVSGIPAVLLKKGKSIYAIGATCTHLGGPLDEGELKDGVVQCPWHGSCFRMSDGSVVNGPAVYAEPTFAVRVRSGKIELRRLEHA